MSCSLRLLLASTIAMLPYAALAQTAPAEEEPTSIWQQETLTGDWWGLRKRLEDAGVKFGLQEQSELWGNMAGGLRTGVVYDGLTTGSLRIDLNKLVGWPDATFFVSGYQIHGRGPTSNLVGNLQVVSGVEAMRETRLYDLWLEQRLFDGKLSIRAGQEGANDELMLVESAALFLNASFGFPASAASDLPSGGPNYPLPAPFVRVKYQPNDAITLMGAVFDGNPAPPGEGDPQQRDPSGTAFRHTDHALVFVELGYSRGGEKAEDVLPGTFKLGGWLHYGHFDDPLLDTNGLSLANPASNGVPHRHAHDYAIYAIADQTIWRAGEKSPEAIALFLQVIGSPGDRDVSNLAVLAGLNWKAPFAGRDADSFGIGVAYEGIGSSIRHFGADRVFFTGMGEPYRSNETVVEVTYQFQVAPWLMLQPDAQYVINPGAGIPSAFSPRPLRDAFVAGVRATITF